MHIYPEQRRRARTVGEKESPTIAGPVKFFAITGSRAVVVSSHSANGHLLASALSSTHDSKYGYAKKAYWLLYLSPHVRKPVLQFPKRAGWFSRARWNVVAISNQHPQVPLWL